MQGYLKLAVTAVLMMTLSAGCGFATKKQLAAVETDVPEHQEDAGPGLPNSDKNNKTAQDAEEFYWSLPELKLPIAWSEYGDTELMPVPENISTNPDFFNFSYSFGSFMAARLPERDGLRFILISYEEENGDNATGLFTFSATTMERIGYRYLYSVEEIGGGADILVMTFAMDENMEITLTSEYNGHGPGGKHITELFQNEFITPLPDGNFRKITDISRTQIWYRRPFAPDDDNYNPYFFEVHALMPVINEETGMPEQSEQIKLYMVDDNIELVEVDEFP